MSNKNNQAAHELTKEQFDVVAKLIRSREPPKTAAYLVLVEGLSNRDAMEQTNVAANSMSNTLTRFRRAHRDILSAYRLADK